MSLLIKTYSLPSGQVIEIAQGDLTKERVDAIVNAANSRLAHGGGAGAIRNAGASRSSTEARYGCANMGRSLTQSSPIRMPETCPAAMSTALSAQSEATVMKTANCKKPYRYLSVKAHNL